MRVLFLTTRNVITSSGEMRLIKNRMQAMKEEWNIDTVFYALVARKKLTSNKRENLDAAELNVYGYDLKKPLTTLSTINNYKKDVMNRLRVDKDIKVIIISGIFPLSLLKDIRREYPSIRIITDIHATTKELIEYPQKRIKKYGIQYLIYTLFQCNFSVQAKYTHGALVVSTALMEHFKNQYRPKEDYKFYIVPCGVNKSNFDVEKSLEYRKKWRQEFGIKDDELLFIYSGGVSDWQMIDETIGLYTKIEKSISYKSRLLIMSHDIDIINQRYKISGDVILRRFTPEEVQQVLFSGDFAFLLRQNRITNNVAFPNKYGEYVLAGLDVICSSSLYDPSDLTLRYNTGIVIDESMENIIEEIECRVKKRKRLINDIIHDRKELIKLLSFSYTQRDFVNDIINRL